MTDLTFCYIHMSKNELFTIDTIETADYIRGDLDDDVDLDIPLHMMPPNPDDSESTHISVLPSQVHPSYPYGNPTSAKHPINQPHTLAFDPSSRALFEDMGFAGGGINGAFRWNELALDQLLPIDEEKEEAKRAAQARKMASGAGGGGQQQGQQPPHQQQPGGPPQDLTLGDDDDDDEDEEDEDEDDEDDEDEDDEDEDEDEEGVNSDEEEELFGNNSDEEDE